MLREKCGTCGSGEVYHGRVMGQGGISLFSARSMFKAVTATKCLACVNCGTLAPYLDEKAMAKVRDWRTSESMTPGSVPSENAGDQQQSLMIGLMILAAIIGIVAAIVIPRLTMPNPLK